MSSRESMERNGAMKEIQLTQGQVAKVSDHRFDELNQYKWHAKFENSTQSYYACRHTSAAEGARMVRMHREIMKTPVGMQCDHINHDTLDNRDENLRNCTFSQNQMNRGVQRNSKSGYKGVHFKKRENKFVVQIVVDGKDIYLGSFLDAVTAAKVYDEGAKKYHGSFAKLNFPEAS